MAGGIESEEVAKVLVGNDGTGDGILLRHRLLKKELQGFPGATTQIGKKIPVIEEVPAQDFRDAEDDMSVGNLPEHLKTETSLGTVADISACVHPPTPWGLGSNQEHLPIYWEGFTPGCLSFGQPLTTAKSSKLGT
jgi:hypothetical protein